MVGTIAILFFLLGLVVGVGYLLYKVVFDYYSDEGSFNFLIAAFFCFCVWGIGASIVAIIGSKELTAEQEQLKLEMENNQKGILYKLDRGYEVYNYKEPASNDLIGRFKEGFFHGVVEVDDVNKRVILIEDIYSKSTEKYDYELREAEVENALDGIDTH